MHKSFESLHKHINKDILPTEYGGSAGSLASITADLPDKIMQRREWFVEDEQYKTDESKRPRKPKKSKADRSIKNLEIDWTSVCGQIIIDAKYTNFIFIME